MFVLCSHRRNVFRLTVLIIGGVLLYNEYLVYFIFSLTWPNLTCGTIQNLYSVMLVADPQILGERSEIWISRWDNDRYLKRSFATAFHHVKPDLVIFLGDLMDEGSLATDEEYQRYLQRFKEIFQLDYIPVNKTAFLPGDNDIGGEDELVTDKKVDRFRRHFASPTVFYLGRVQFVQVDKMQRVVPLVPPLSPSDNRTRIVVSHMPLLGLPSALAAEVLQKLRPHVILSAHDHKLARFSGDIETGERLTVDTSSDNWLADWKSSWRFQRSEHQTYEVVVPTCSYRMGVSDMGFGVALFDKRGEAWCYHELWLPSRFYALIMYLFITVVVLAPVVVMQCCVRPCRSRHRSSLPYRSL